MRYARIYHCGQCDTLGMSVNQLQMAIQTEPCWSCGSELSLATLASAEVPDVQRKELVATT